MPKVNCQWTDCKCNTEGVCTFDGEITLVADGLTKWTDDMEETTDHEFLICDKYDTREAYRRPVGSGKDESESDDKEETRVCTKCKSVMSEGFCIGDGEAYYCSKDCLHSEISPKEYSKLYASGHAYWTQW